MDQLILNLGNIENIGGLDGYVCQAEKEGEGQDNTDGLLDRSNQLSRDVDEVLSEALESSIEQQEHDTNSSVESKLIRCQERQVALESRFRRMQERISKLRAIRVGQHAAEQIQMGVVSCEKRIACQRGVVNERPRTESAVLDRQGNETVKRRLKDGEPKIRRTKMRKYNKKKADETFGQLYGHLRHVQRFLDPEATESSSGGDSADEDEKYTPGAVLYAPIKERAKYRYLKKRCLYASQWGWLLCQISDLEFRIRQQNEMYRVYRDGKGAVTLDDSGTTQSSLHGRKFIGATQGSDGIMRRPVEFDYNSEENSEDELTQTCSRVRPINRVKRRKLVDTYSLHETSSRVGKPSSVSCTCLVPTEWCILCLGRRNPKQTLDPYSYSRAESIALLDHSYHAVLSTKPEIPLNLALIQGVVNNSWVNLAGVVRNPSVPSHLSKVEDINDREVESVAAQRFVRRTEKSLKRRTREDRLDRLGKDTRKGVRSRPGTPEMSTNMVIKEIKEIRDGRPMARIRDTNSLQEQTRRKRKNSFDIDHIVIPYSMPSTRVEKPKYKEIQTPSWREVDKPYPWPPPGSSKKELSQKPQPPKPSTRDLEFEDISDLTMKILHAQAEEEERIRWATPLGRVHGGQRQRANRARRLDSCLTEASSGANTPDPLSPGLVEDILVQTRPSSPQEETILNPGSLPSVGGTSTTPFLPTTAAPPTPGTSTAPLNPVGATSTTPLTPLGASHSAPLAPTVASSTVPFTPINIISPWTPASVKNRRRTSSQTKSRDRNLSEASQQSQESSRSTSPWTEAEEYIQPYEMRQFPLTEEEEIYLQDDDEVEVETDVDTKMRPPPPPPQDNVSTHTSRTTSRSSSTCGESEDPDWEEGEGEDEQEYEATEEDPEYTPRKGEEE